MLPKDIADCILALGLHYRWIVALWFVDRDAEYMAVLKAFSTDLEYLSAPIRLRDPLVPRLYGVPLFTFTSQGAAERNLSRPAFCSTPGVWLEMADGEHIQLDKEVTDA